MTIILIALVAFLGVIVANLASAALEGAHYLACELDPAHVQIARRRLTARIPLPLFEAPTP